MKHLLLYVMAFTLGACAPAVPTDVAVTTTSTPHISWIPEENTIFYRGDAGRSGQYELATLEAPVDLLWKTQVGPSVHGAPLLVAETLLIPTVAARFVALDANTGDEKWTFRASGDLFSSPAVEQDVIYIGNENGHLYALALETGFELWSLQLGSGIWTAPLIIDETIFVGSQSGTVFAIDTILREVRWQYSGGGWVMSPIAWEEDVLFVSAGPNLVALNDETGAAMWRKSIGEFWGPPAVMDGVVYAGNDDNSFYALDALSGEVLWSFDGGDDGWSAPAVTADTVFFGNRLNQLFALNSKTGELRWTFPTEDWVTTDPIVVDGVVYLAVGNHDNRDGPRPLYAIDAASGQELWRFQADGRLLTPPAAGEGTLYFASFLGTVYAVE